MSKTKRIGRRTPANDATADGRMEAIHAIEELKKEFLAFIWNNAITPQDRLLRHERIVAALAGTNFDAWAVARLFYELEFVAGKQVAIPVLLAQAQGRTLPGKQPPSAQQFFEQLTSTLPNEFLENVEATARWNKTRSSSSGGVAKAGLLLEAKLSAESDFVKWRIRHPGPRPGFKTFASRTCEKYPRLSGSYNTMLRKWIPEWDKSIAK